MSSLSGKASRILVESRGMPSHSTCILRAEPCKLDMFSKPSLVNLISKDANLVLHISVYKLFHSSNY